MKRALIAAACLLSAPAVAQRAPHWGALYQIPSTDGTDPTVTPPNSGAGGWDQWFGSKADYSNLLAEIARAQAAEGAALNFANASPGLVTPQGAQNAYALSALATQSGIVPDWFKTTADGSDDAPSIQRALTAACATGANKLNMLARHYAIASAIVQTCPTLVQGQGWQEAPTSIATAGGTWLDIMGTSFVPWTIQGQPAKGAEIRDLAIDQPAQPAAPTTGTWTPAAYQYVFSVQNVGGYVGFKHIAMDGVTNGIASFNGGRTIIDGLWGQFFNNAINFDQETDVSRIYDLHDWPVWNSNAPVIAYQQAHHASILLGRVDGPIIDKVFVFAALSGVQTYTGAQGGTTTGLQSGTISCDSVTYCLAIEAPGMNGQISLIREFGQSGVSSGIPLSGATAIKIDGSATLQIGSISAALIDQAVVVETSTTACSNVQAGSIYADFSASAESTVNLMSAVVCSNNGAAANLSVGITPAVLAPGKTLTPSGGGGAIVYYPTAVSH